MQSRMKAVDLMRFKLSVDGQIKQTKTGWEFTSPEFTYQAESLTELSSLVMNRVWDMMTEQWVTEVMGGES